MLKSLTVRQEGEKVLLLSGGILIAEMPWQAADQLAAALKAKARQAEELQKAEQIAFDQAVLMRGGFPIGLTRHKAIISEAVKQAFWNTDLRRYMPGGVKSQEIFGTPAIIRHLPKGEPDNAKNS